MTSPIIDLFAGPGGWDTGLAVVGRRDVLGIEWDQAACDTAEAAGHTRLLGDIAELDPLEVAGSHVEGLIASPPCQGFSMAGKGKGRGDTPLIVAAVDDIASGVDPDLVLDTLRHACDDHRSALVLEPLRWALALEPEWLAWEQVPLVLPLWEACAEVLRQDGYNVWCGNVQAEQYGVPQTRKRAILIAHRTREVGRPAPTHSRYHNRTPERLDPGVAKWVSMAEALGWGVNELVGFPRRADDAARAAGVVTIDGTDYRARDLFHTDRPAPVVTEKARSWSRWEMGDVRSSNGTVRDADQPAPTLTASMDNGNYQWRFAGAGITAQDRPTCRQQMRDMDQPAHTITGKGTAYWVADREAVAAEVEPRVNNQSGTDFDLAWPADRPAPTIAGRELVTMPGANANRYNGSTKSRNDGIRVTVDEAAMLQAFPAGYPWQGTKTAQFRQVGDAVPPLLAARVLESLGVGVVSTVHRTSEREGTG